MIGLVIAFPQMVMVYKAGEKKFDIDKIQINVPEEQPIFRRDPVAHRVRRRAPPSRKPRSRPNGRSERRQRPSRTRPARRTSARHPARANRTRTQGARTRVARAVAGRRRSRLEGRQRCARLAHRRRAASRRHRQSTAASSAAQPGCAMKKPRRSGAFPMPRCTRRLLARPALRHAARRDHEVVEAVLGDAGTTRSGRSGTPSTVRRPS